MTARNSWKPAKVISFSKVTEISSGCLEVLRVNIVFLLNIESKYDFVTTKALFFYSNEDKCYFLVIEMDDMR